MKKVAKKKATPASLQAKAARKAADRMQNGTMFGRKPRAKGK